jgi:hypothetical protein
MLECQQWVDHCQPWTSAIRWFKLRVSFPAVRSRARPAQADPQKPVAVFSASSRSALKLTFIDAVKQMGDADAQASTSGMPYRELYNSGRF